ncbi:hypothetical protein L2E82_23244 [Cichorium intybus]|uniref:Uncharacterized protein n=1 Tax=Cichorium intybus TaxID=13427 RepID=A0ACB9E0V2_CICIN|nr:hypothetical protein L2E82_23244 [Cichorium intybus]
MEERWIEAIDRLVELYASNGMFEEVVKNLRESNKSVDGLAYAYVIQGFVKEWKLQDAEVVFLYVKLREVVPDRCTLLWRLTSRQSWFFLDAASFNIAIDAACKLGKMDDVMGLLEDMKGRKFTVLGSTNQ